MVADLLLAPQTAWMGTYPIAPQLPFSLQASTMTLSVSARPGARPLPARAARRPAGAARRALAPRAAASADFSPDQLQVISRGVGYECGVRVWVVCVVMSTAKGPEGPKGGRAA